MRVFDRCLEALEKNAGLMDSVKRLALTEVPGTKPWFIRPAAEKASLSKAMGKRTMSGVRPAVTRRTAGGAYDVSELARQMGLDK